MGSADLRRLYFEIFELVGSFGMKVAGMWRLESVCRSRYQILDRLCLRISPGLPFRADAELPVWLCGHPDISGR